MHFNFVPTVLLLLSLLPLAVLADHGSNNKKVSLLPSSKDHVLGVPFRKVSNKITEKIEATKQAFESFKLHAKTQGRRKNSLRQEDSCPEVMAKMLECSNPIANLMMVDTMDTSSLAAQCQAVDECVKAFESLYDAAKDFPECYSVLKGMVFTIKTRCLKDGDTFCAKEMYSEGSAVTYQVGRKVIGHAAS